MATVPTFIVSPPISATGSHVRRDGGMVQSWKVLTRVRGRCTSVEILGYPASPRKTLCVQTASKPPRLLGVLVLHTYTPMTDEGKDWLSRLVV